MISCSPATPDPAPTKGKDKTAESPLLWEVRLADTVLFPEGGGQPCDVGTIGSSRVVKVVNIDGEAVHFVDAPLQPESAVEARVDWDHRWDVMQQHSAQHLVTALAIDMFDYQTESWCLGAEITTLDLATKQVTPEQLQALERRVNQEIAEEHVVGPRWIDMDSEEVATIRCRGLPEGIKGPLRVLEIKGIDTNLCCGTHVKNTSHLRQVKLLRVEHMRDKGQDRARLHFLAGDRILDTLGAAFDRQLKLNILLSSNTNNAFERVEQVLKAEKDMKKQLKGLLSEVVELTAETLKHRAGAGERVLTVHREGGDMDFMRSLATALDGSGALLFTTIGGPKSGQFMLSGPERLVKENGPKIAELLSGRGGGKGRFQAKVEDLSKRDEAIALLKSAH